MRNTLPPVAYTQHLEDSLAGNMGVSVEGSQASIPGDDNYHALSNHTLTLPPIDPGLKQRWIEVYSKGTEKFDFLVTPHNPWVRANPSSGTITPGGKDVRVHLTIDWANAPAGVNMAHINISSSLNYGNTRMPIVYLPVNNTRAPSGFKGFVESDRTVSIEAEHYSRKTDGENAHYAVIPDFGRTLSGVTLLPGTAPSQTAPGGPRLEYDMHVFTAGYNANITVILGTAFNTDPSRPLKYAIAIDDEAPQVVQYIQSTRLGTRFSTWNDVVAASVWTASTAHRIAGGGRKHTLKLWALEPAVVFEKVVVNLGGVRPSYLGPPESPRV
jgi:hypothetical protein